MKSLGQRASKAMVKISRAVMSVGLGLCISNVGRYIEDTRILIYRNSIHAAITLIFGLEEMGKLAHFLASMKGNNDPVEIDDRIFREHEFKLTVARGLLGADALILHEGDFDEEDFSADFDISTNVSPVLRLSCTFVDYKDGDWLYGEPFDRQRFQELVDTLERRFGELRAEAEKVMTGPSVKVIK